MVDINSSSSSVNKVDTVTKTLENRVTTSDGVEKARAVEKISKVGGEQHERTLNYLMEKIDLSKHQAVSGAVTSELGTEEVRKKTKRHQTENKNKNKNESESEKKTMTLNPQHLENASFEEVKKESQNNKTQNTTTQENAEVKPVLTNDKPGTSDPEIGASQHKPITGALEPPIPPPPVQFPDGFSMDSLDSSNHVAMFTKIMAAVSNLMSEGAMERMEANRQYQAQSSKLNLEQIRKTETEQLQKQEKLDIANNIVSCATQILMVIVTAIMVGVSVLTGGAAMIIVAMLSVALLVVDSALQATGNQTVTGAIMQPLMDNVIAPMAEFFASFIDDILIFFNMPEHIAEVVAMVLGYIVAIAVIFVLVMVVKNSAIMKAAMRMIGQLLGKLVAKLTPSVIAGLGKSLSGTMASVAKTVGTKANVGGSSAVYKSTYEAAIKNGVNATDAIVDATMASGQALARGTTNIANVMSISGQGVAGVGAATTGGAGIASAVLGLDVSESRADLTQLFAEIMVNSDILKEIQKQISGMMETSTQMMEIALAMQESRNSTVRDILQKMSKGV